MSGKMVQKRFYSNSAIDLGHAKRFAKARLEKQTVLLGNVVFEPVKHWMFPDGIKFECIVHGKLSHSARLKSGR